MVLIVGWYLLAIGLLALGYCVEWSQHRAAEKFGQWAAEDRDRQKARADLLAIRLEKALNELAARGVGGKDRA
jgi:hypothetical protein